MLECCCWPFFSFNSSLDFVMLLFFFFLLNLVFDTQNSSNITIRAEQSSAERPCSCCSLQSSHSHEVRFPASLSWLFHVWYNEKAHRGSNSWRRWRGLEGHEGCYGNSPARMFFCVLQLRGDWCDPTWRVCVCVVYKYLRTKCLRLQSLHASHWKIQIQMYLLTAKVLSLLCLSTAGNPPNPHATFCHYCVSEEKKERWQSTVVASHVNAGLLMFSSCN